MVILINIVEAAETLAIEDLKKELNITNSDNLYMFTSPQTKDLNPEYMDRYIHLYEYYFKIISNAQII